MATKTNNDIIKLLNLQHDEVKDRLVAMEEQVKYTNGQVRKLNTWKAVMEDREARAAQSGPNPKSSGWDWKAYLALLATIATIFAGVVSK